MRYFIDTEYDFNAKDCRVTPISIGVVAEDGREYYGILKGSWDRFLDSPFVRKHVLPVLDRLDVETMIDGHEGIAADLRAFVGHDPMPEFWGDYADFDYVVLSIVMGGFDGWPQGWPMFLHDLQQTPEGRAASETQSDIPHHALSDARALRDAYALAFGAVGGR